MSPTRQVEPADKGELLDISLRTVRDALRDLQVGYVTLIVQDGVIIQIERREARQLRPPRIGPVSAPSCARNGP